MVIVGDFFNALALLVNGVFQILYIILILRIVLSWLPVDPYHNFVQVIYQTSEYLLLPFRRLPLQIGMIDLTPLVAYFALFFLRSVLLRILVTLSHQFGGAAGY